MLTGTAARWLLLLLCSAALTAAMLALNMPAAVLLGCMACAIGFALRGAGIALPKRIFGLGQGVLGCLMAQSLHPEALGSVLVHWPAVAGVTLVVFVASGGLGWWMMRRQVMPGTTAVWGMSPGGAAAMVAMAEEFGADARLVAFMQYTRVIAVTVVAALVARATGDHTSQAAVPTDWLAWGEPSALAITCVLVVGGEWIASRVAVPGGSMLITLAGAVFAQIVFGLSPGLPPLLLAAAYAAIGWSVGLRFTRDVLRHALRTFPIVLLCMAILMAVCALSGVALVLVAGLDPLTAYLATSPGGIDSMAVIAATSHVDMSFVMAVQLARFLMVLTVGPSASRWLARHAPTSSINPH